MTWPIAFFASFSVFIISLIAFFTIIYFKEFSREEKTIKEFTKLAKQEKDLPAFYMMAPPVKSVAPAPPKLVKNKKDIN